MITFYYHQSARVFFFSFLLLTIVQVRRKLIEDWLPVLVVCKDWLANAVDIGSILDMVLELHLLLNLLKVFEQTSLQALKFDLLFLKFTFTC